MQSILFVFLTLTGILLLATLNKVFMKMLYRKQTSVKIKILSIIGLIIVNLIIMFAMHGVLGKLMFLLPFILLAPASLVFFNKKD